MRRLPAGVAISAAVHAVAIVWASAVAPTPADTTIPRTPSVELVDVVTAPLETAPVEVALLPPDAAPVREAAPAAVASTTRPSRRELPARSDGVASTVPSTSTEPASGSPESMEHPPGRDRMFDMRRGRVDLT